MNQSTELLDLVNNFCEALSKSDFELVEKLLSKQDKVLIIGSDPNDWYEGHKKIISVLREEIGHIGEPDFEISHLNAYHEGIVGWASSLVTMKTPQGSEIPFRWTWVFQIEEDDWKVIQWHASIAVPNASIGQVISA
jgi:limonene-1,2-epoxide hydrolase